MNIALVITLLGGLALFLYGMQMMSDGLEAAAGSRMKQILNKLTSNRFLGVAVGAVITAVIQSSSATTVMVVGFVNTGLMTLKQAVWIIMGANIGTTITGQLIALDIGAIAPLIAFAGVALVVFFKRDVFHHYGNIIAGLGILFIGMEMMSSSMEPLRDSEAFVNLVGSFRNPLVGILAGTIFTAIIQSSSASVGILQALALSGVIGLDNAVYVLFGQNIGTCITSVLASIGTSRNAKRTTIIHLLFNIIGTTIFTVVCMTTPLTELIKSITPGNPVAQIANTHTMFNIATTVLLIPFGGYLAKLAMLILPDREVEEDLVQYHLEYIQAAMATDENNIGSSLIARNNIERELFRMTDMTVQNLYHSFTAAKIGAPLDYEKFKDTEEYIDYLNKEISKYISHIIAHDSNERDSSVFSSFFKISGNLERIGDHATNIFGYTRTLERLGITFSEQAQAEITQMQSICNDAMKMIHNKPEIDIDQLTEISATEQKIDDMTKLFRQNQLERMHSGHCSDEACILYSELLTDFERVGDHVLNIGQALASIGTMN